MVVGIKDAIGVTDLLIYFLFR
uniref:Uncharacterized protein n=1 Tax=Anguilla anguilla TaxID=7936 RepID=A0A0E9URE6_ANGAN